MSTEKLPEGAQLTALDVQPKSLEFRGPFDYAQVLVTGKLASGETPDVTRLAAEVAKISPADAPNVARFLNDNRHKLELFRPCLERPFSGWTDLIRWQLIKLFPTLRPWASLDAELGRYFSDARIRLAFSFQSKYLGMSPFNCPSLFSILSFLEYEYGVWHPTGGCSAVSDHLARIAREMGVRISLGEEVKEVLFEGRRAVGVRTASGEHRADALVINADFAHAMTHLVDARDRRTFTDENLRGRAYSCSTFMLYLGIDGRWDAPHHNIFFSRDYRQFIGDVAGGRVSQDPSMYVQNASVTDPTLAPAGKSTLYALVPMPNNTAGIAWTADQVAAMRDQVLTMLEQRGGMPDIRRRIEVERVMTPQDWESRTNVYHGAVFNLAHTLDQMMYLRPHNRFQEFGRCYLVGGGTHPGSGLPTIYESGRIAADLISRDIA